MMEKAMQQYLPLVGPSHYMAHMAHQNVDLLHQRKTTGAMHRSNGYKGRASPWSGNPVDNFPIVMTPHQKKEHCTFHYKFTYFDYLYTVG